MTQSEIIAEIAKETNFDKECVEKIIRALWKVITDKLKNNIEVKFHGFGKFIARPYGKRNCYNPMTKGMMVLKPSVQPAFIPGPTLREKLNEDQ